MIGGKISVIVPVHNVEEYLPECLESIVRQTYRNLEVILVDDGSTDRSGAICDEHAGKDDRFVVVHQKNQGVSAARNKALGIATGDYIGFVDGDDAIHEDMFGILLKSIKDCGAHVSVCQWTNDRRNLANPANVLQALTEKFDSSSAIKSILCGTPFAGHLCNKLFARELVIGKTLSPELRILEDLAFVVNVLANNPDSIVVFHDIKLYYYRVRNDSAYNSRGLTSKLSSRAALDYIQHCVDKKNGSIIPYVNGNRIMNDISLLASYDAKTDSKYDFRSILVDLRERLSWRSLKFLPNNKLRAQALFAFALPRGYAKLKQLIGIYKERRRDRR